VTAPSHALRSTILAAALTITPQLEAQESAAKMPPKISDNSFFVEEAYNQEAGVVQHIGNFRRSPDGHWVFTFTQEWPAPSQRHQLSYTVPVLSARGMGTGLGDLAVNYRYQAIGRDEERVWFAPRISVLIPSGDTRYDRGVGGPGVQVNLPISIELGPALVTHWNAGATLTRSHASTGVRGTPRSLNAAASAIYLLSPNLNLMLEGVWERAEWLSDVGPILMARRALIVPGVRGAFNFGSGMQIVPGIGVPIAGRSSSDRDLFLYLSVEHPFR
jgi:hypothetical protein